MKISKKLIAAFLVSALALGVLPGVESQGSAANFGTQVMDGDNDFVAQVAAATNNTIPVIRYHGGEENDMTNDVFVLDLDEGGTITKDDLVLATGGFDGTTVGGLITNSMTLLLGKTGDTATDTDGDGAAIVADAFLSYANVVDNGRWDAGDYAYLTGYNASAGDLLATKTFGSGTDAATFSIRLTPAGDFEAGSLVRQGDSDLIAYGTNVQTLMIDGGSPELFFFDADLDTAFRTGDSLYLTNGAGLVDQYAIRLFGGDGGFGTIVGLGDSDFVPTMSLASNNNLETVRYLGSDPDDMTDDVIVLNVDDDAVGGIERDDIVLYAKEGAPEGVAVGDLVKQTNELLIGKGSVGDAEALYVDVDENGRYNVGDWGYICGGSGTSTLKATTTSLVDFCIRMTEGNPNGAPGSLVRAGDNELVQYSSLQRNFPTTVPEFVAFDGNQDGDFDDQDVGYIAFDDVTQGNRTGFGWWRVAGSAGAFGSVVNLGDSDFRPALDRVFAFGIVRYEGDNSNSADDDVFVFDVDDDGSTIEQYDIVIYDGLLGKALGASINVGDTTLTGRGTALTPNVITVDVDENTFYSTGDWVYLSSQTSLTATTKSEYTIRLTDTTGGKAGTLVKAGDDDLITYGSTSGLVDDRTSIANLAQFEGDFDVGGKMDHALDRLYLAIKSGLSAGDLVPLASVRLVGDFNSGPITTPPVDPVEPVDPVDPVPPVDPVDPVPPVDPVTPPVTPPVDDTHDDDDDTKTPGFELVALIAALGAGLVLVRRRL